jgi:hypothetical protein
MASPQHGSDSPLADTWAAPTLAAEIRSSALLLGLLGCVLLAGLGLALLAGLAS